MNSYLAEVVTEARLKEGPLGHRQRLPAAASVIDRSSQIFRNRVNSRSAATHLEGNFVLWAALEFFLALLAHGFSLEVLLAFVASALDSMVLNGVEADRSCDSKLRSFRRFGFCHSHHPICHQVSFP